jgi:hypothetical protein
MIIDCATPTTTTSIKPIILWNQLLARRNGGEPVRRTSRTVSGDSLSSAEIHTDHHPMLVSKEISAVEYDGDNENSYTNMAIRQPEKRVRFQVDDNDNIVAQVMILTQSIEDENVSELFWSASERRQFAKNMRAAARTAKKDFSTQIEHLKDLYCNSVYRDVTSEETKIGMKAIMQWSHSAHDCRGLERLVLDGASEIATGRCIRNVLRAQWVQHEQQRRCAFRNCNNETSTFSLDEAAKQLRQRSRKSSRLAEEFALLLAMGDSVE